MPIEELKRPERIDEDRIEKLKDLFPEAFRDGKLNIEILKEEIEGIKEDLIDNNFMEFYGLQWTGKKEAKKLALVPDEGTLQLAIGEGINEETTNNVFIEGDNLEVLRILKKSYAGKIKMIYIDPPYNTGNDFIYKDNYTESIDKYLQRTSQADEDGLLTSNPKASGRYHADWLTMMYPRLRLARHFLKEDGVIFVSIDDHEFSNLKQIMDEIFGENNFVATFTWKRRASSAMADQMVSTDHEYILCYQREKFNSFFGLTKDFKGYSNPDNDPRGEWTKGDLTVGMTKEQRPNQFYDLVDPETGRVFPANPRRVWSFIPDSMKKLIDDGRIVFPNSEGGQPMLKRFKSELKTSVNPVSTWINESSKLIEEEGKVHLQTGLNSEGTKVVQELFGEKVFDYPKPVSLIKSLIKQVCKEDDIVLDFFAGSGTTAHSILELNAETSNNLKFLLIQLPVNVDRSDFTTITDITKERIKKVIDALNKKDNNSRQKDRGFSVYKLVDTHIKKWKKQTGNNIEWLNQNLSLFESGPFKEASKPKSIVLELMLKAGYPLDSNIIMQHINLNDIWIVKHVDVPFTLIVCFDDKLHAETADFVVSNYEGNTFICLDNALSDQQKVSISESMNVKTI
ncbi:MULTISPECIES: site-specific DNA-methyltransferase [Bacillus]|nr:site-specific DNA-methyltransferase [Bacillus subtilis]KIO57290.1 Type III restriction-modification system methylation subunit [Bacillus subtilis]QGI32867.1 site-specific DNA-methyltransferase [Bacillus subtilis]WHX53501.1 site-specific DNA-methyltransferase [Bacillus subtilis]WHX57503.1 site-specific DNA-methyltransferase [Bacillus subtilis]WHX95871.1 site-specific DNA-methyltransferase [Bacillus subtilis]